MRKDINFFMNTFKNKYPHRLFAFGCSYTKYDYPTYADYIGQHYEEFHNMGSPGAGNTYIATTLSETILSHSLTSEDRVIVQWTNTSREDYFMRDKNNSLRWHPNICHDKVEMYEHYVKKDFAYMHLTLSTLQYYHIPFIFLSHSRILPPHYTKNNIQLTELYYDVLYHIQESMKQCIFNYQSPLTAHRKDAHPTQKEHEEYVNSHLSHLLRNEWNET